MTTYVNSAIVDLGTSIRSIKVKGEERLINLVDEGFKYIPKAQNDTEKDILGLISSSYVHLCKACNGSEDSYALYEEKIAKLLEVCGLPKSARLVMPAPKAGKKSDVTAIRLCSKNVYTKTTLRSLYCFAMGDIDVAEVDENGKAVKKSPSIEAKIAKLDEAKRNGLMDEKTYKLCMDLLAA